MLICKSFRIQLKIMICHQILILRLFLQQKVLMEHLKIQKYFQNCVKLYVRLLLITPHLMLQNLCTIVCLKDYDLSNVSVKFCAILMRRSKDIYV